MSRCPRSVTSSAVAASWAARGRNFRTLFCQSIDGRLKVCSIRLELPALGLDGRLTRLQSGRLGRVLVSLLLQVRALLLDATPCVHSFRAFNRRLLSRG